jgi:carboxynorspermidine decarboxylase
LNGVDFSKLQTPSYVIDKRELENNLQILFDLKKRSGAKILLALKGYAYYSSFDLVRKYLDGATASGLYEAKLAYENLGLKVHTYSVAFSDYEIDDICKISNCIVFNSFKQFEKYKETASDIDIGMRVNPQISFAPKNLYSPCLPNSRLGVLIDDFPNKIPKEITGLHFHALCEQGVESLEIVLNAFEKQFGDYLHRLNWVNFGGGHHITQNGYDVDRLVDVIISFREKYNIDIYLEPGEAVALNCGYLVCSVLDIIEKENHNIAIIDTSFEAHMPDCLIIPYKPDVVGSTSKGYKYSFGGISCIAGDFIDGYHFDKQLNIGDKIIFCDMAHYSFVKNTTFNGLRLPSLAEISLTGELDVIKTFGYKEYKSRLS